MVQVELFLFDLLLKQRMEHDSGGAGILERLELVEVFREGCGSPHHQGTAQRQAEIGGGEIHAHDAPARAL